MSDSYIIRDQSARYFLTFQVVGWVDIFTRRRYRDIIVDAFNYCVDSKGLMVHAWCIMSNHVHSILSSRNSNLSDVVRDFKRHTSKQLLKSILEEPESRREWMLFQFKHAAQQHNRNEKYQIWAHENHALVIDPHLSAMFESKLNYIHTNPVKEGIVEHNSEYLYSSDVDYSGRKGLIKMELLCYLSAIEEKCGVAESYAEYLGLQVMFLTINMVEIS